MKQPRRSRRRLGQTLVEMVLALSMTALVCLVGMGTFLIGMEGWFRGRARIECEVDSQDAVRKVATQLRLAMNVVVDPDGQGLNYELPQLDGGGTIENPLVWDGVNRRIALSGSNLVLSTSGMADQTLCSNVITTDPLSTGGLGTYKIFTAGVGSVTRSLTVMVVSKEAAYNMPDGVYGRHRETIFFRNVSQIDH